jgi:hypothetical protein
MILSHEWNSCVQNTKVDGQAISQLVRQNQSFWMRVKELCNISEPLVKIIFLVNGDKPTMGYLYEAMDRVKEGIHWYYKDMGEEEFIK